MVGFWGMLGIFGWALTRPFLPLERPRSISGTVMIWNHVSTQTYCCQCKHDSINQLGTYNQQSTLLFISVWLRTLNEHYTCFLVLSFVIKNKYCFMWLPQHWPYYLLNSNSCSLSILPNEFYLARLLYFIMMCISQLLHNNNIFLNIQDWTIDFILK